MFSGQGELSTPFRIITQGNERAHPAEWYDQQNHPKDPSRGSSTNDLL
jgi:hypothetical protein